MHPHYLVLVLGYRDGIKAPMGSDGGPTARRPRFGSLLRPEHRRSSDSPGLHRLLWVVGGYLFVPPGWRCLFREAEMTDLARLWAWGTRSLNGLKFQVHLAHSVG